MKEIKIFGDSVLKGVVYDKETGRYHICKDKLRLTKPSVVNLSKMGATSESGLKIVNRQLTSCNENTVAIIEYGGNDCNYDWSAISADPEINPDCVVMKDEYINNLKKMTAMLRSTGARVVFTTLVPICESKFMNYITKGLSYKNILTWLGTVHRLYEWQKYYSDLCSQTARELGCEVIDLRSTFDYDMLERLICEDGIHPTEEGHGIIHRFLEKQVAQLV